MPRRRPNGGERATGRERAVVFGDAFRNVTQGLVCMQEALRLQGQEAMRRQEEAERRHQEALRLQEQRNAAALHEAVGQMEAKLQEKDDAIHALEQRLKETQERVEVVEVKADGLVRSAEEEGLTRLEGRLQELEDSLQRTMQKFFPRVDGLLRQLEGTPPRKASSFPHLPSTSSGATCGEAATEEGAAGGLEDNPPQVESLAPSASSPAFPPPSSSSSAASAPGASVSEAAGHQTERPHAGQGTQAEDERVQRQRIERRVQDVKGKVRTACNAPSQHREVLLSAIRNGRLGEIERLLDDGAEVNYVNKDGSVPLLVAVQTGQLDVVALLLLRGADVNAVDERGTSVMHWAAFDERCSRSLGLLLAAGGDANARSVSGVTPLHWAAENNEAAVRALLAAGARTDLKPWDGPWANRTPVELTTSAEIRELLRSGLCKWIGTT
ncbi:Uncharacterized protein GBIM_15786, partial [Gryllus bimaculatus]